MIPLRTERFLKLTVANIWESSYEVWADQVNYTVQKAWMALLLVMRTVKKGNKNTKILAYTSLVRPILEYGAACWDPYRECQISALDSVQNKAAKFGHHSEGSDWESLGQRRKTARTCALYKAYTGERAWKAIEDKLQASCYLVGSIVIGK